MFSLQYEIDLDHEYTAELNSRVRDKFKSKSERNATHLSDLYGCLLKAWGKKHLPKDAWNAPEDAEGDPLLSWGQGLQFEALVSEGQKQAVMAYCWKCRVVSRPRTDKDGREQEVCLVCNTRWLIGTPDYKIDGIIHESKQTRKSQRRGPHDAPWWMEQLAGYLLFERRRGNSVTWGRVVVNWLMGDYGEKRKGKRPRPPQSTLEAFRVCFPDNEDFWCEWEQELHRRQQIVDSKEQPRVSLPGDEFLDSPRWNFECASCPVGLPLECPNYRWNADGDDKEVANEQAKDKPDEEVKLGNAN